MTKQERELLDEMIRNIRAEIVLMNQGIHAEIRAKDEVIMMKLDRIEAQTTKTNGRVDKIEDKTHDLEHFKLESLATMKEAKKYKEDRKWIFTALVALAGLLTKMFLK